MNQPVFLFWKKFGREESWQCTPSFSVSFSNLTATLAGQSTICTNAIAMIGLPSLILYLGLSATVLRRHQSLKYLGIFTQFCIFIALDKFSHAVNVTLECQVKGMRRITLTVTVRYRGPSLGLATIYQSSCSQPEKQQLAPLGTKQAGRS